MPLARSPRGLNCINALMADVWDGVGPDLAVFLTGSVHGSAGAIGIAMAVSAIAATAIIPPAISAHSDPRGQRRMPSAMPLSPAHTMLDVRYGIVF